MSTEQTVEEFLANPSPEFINDVQVAFARFKELDSERKNIGKQMTSLIDALAIYGIDKGAVKSVFRMAELDLEVLRLYDLSAAAMRNALRLGQQGELWLEVRAQETVRRQSGQKTAIN